MIELFQHRAENCPTTWCGDRQIKRPPTPKHNPAPDFYGYDADKVPSIKCMRCKEPIGSKKYKEDRVLARLGQMLFWCQPCVELVGSKW